MSKLHDWWWQFRQANGGFSQSLDTSDRTTMLSKHQCPQEIIRRITSALDLYSDTFTLYCVAVYSAAKVILHSILLAIAASDPTPLNFNSISLIPRHRSTITTHSASVLQVAMHQRLVSPYCGDSVRTVSAVKIVVALAAEDQQRHQARDLVFNCHFGTTAQDSFSLPTMT
jgi:hypothetical protein